MLNQKRVFMFVAVPLMAASLTVVFSCESGSSVNSSVNDWPEYHGGPDRNHYSALSQLDPVNVRDLTQAWEYSSGGSDTTKNQTQIQCNPIIIDGILFGVSAGSQAFALNAATGQELWKTNLKDETFNTTSRGVTYWSDKQDKRIFFAFGNWLYALEAGTGEPIKSFGQEGKINLRDGLIRSGADEYVLSNTPGVVFENLIIMGTRVSEGPTALPGDIRAYDAITGKVVWTFHTIPKPDEFGYDTWPEDAYKDIGGANSWMGMAIDREAGIVFAPTGSAAFDFYGGNRHGANLFANTLLALDARTGKRTWHYQLVHHDIWDRDPPAPPNLITIQKDGQEIKAVAQITKQGYVFIFNRATGEPIFPIVERSVPRTDIPGEMPYPTQPFPKKPAPFSRQGFTESDLNENVADKASVLKMLGATRTGEPYIPITKQRTVIFPGTDGGAQWGGAAVDHEGIMYVPSKEIPVYTSLADAPRSEGVSTGKQLYEISCGACHGADRKGDHSGAYPGLTNIAARMKDEQIRALIAKGRGMMPALTQLSDGEITSIINYINDKEDNSSTAASSTPKSTSPYVHTGYNRWYDSNGFPVNRPPWGTLTAINLSTGERQWQIPLGEYKSLTDKGVPPTGTDNYGGPLVTATGLLFIAATPDKKFRALDKITGNLLWETILPAPGYASPSTYLVDGRQYIVIACGGGKLRSKSGDKYVAFALK